MKKILVIEDNVEMLENISEILEMAKYKVFTAENGKIGVQKAQIELPDLIISDIMMPELDGYGVLYMLGKDPKTARIPLIFLTAKADKADFRKGMGLGADDYLTKPFDDMELLATVETRLKKYEFIGNELKSPDKKLDQIAEKLADFNDLKHFIKSKKTKIFKKKDKIYDEDTYSKYLYFLKKGKVKISKLNEEGKEYIVNLVNENEFFGYLNLLENTELNESASALEESEVVFYESDSFNAFINSNKDLAFQFIRLLAGDIREKEDRLVQLAYNSVRKRVAEALLKLKHKFFEEDNNNKEMSFSREDIANIAGTATETVIRTLSDFQQEKLIQIHSGKITIINADKLERLRN